MQKGPKQLQIKEIQRLGLMAQEQPNFMAQLMSGFRHPKEPSGKEKLTGQAYTLEDYQKIALYIHAKITPPQVIFAQLEQGFLALAGNPEAQKIYLQNAELFINALIRADERQEFLKAVETGLNTFLSHARSDNPELNQLLENIDRSRIEAIQKVKEIQHKKDIISNAPKRDGSFKLQIFVSDKLEKTTSKSDIKKAAIILANDLRELNLSSIRSIHPSDFYNKKWAQPEYAQHLNLSKAIEDFNRVSNLVTHDLLLAKGKMHQKQIYKFYTQVANECLKMGNYQGAFMILSGLQKTSVERFKYLNGGQDNKIDLCDKDMHDNFHLLEKIRTILENKNNYAEYIKHKAEFERHGKMAIPILPLEGRKFTFGEDGNSDKVEGRTNGDKIELLGAFEMDFLSMQDRAYAIPPKRLESDLNTNIAKHRLTDDQLLERSYKILPMGQKEVDFKFYESESYRTDKEIRENPEDMSSRIKLEFAPPAVITLNLDWQQKHPSPDTVNQIYREIRANQAKKVESEQILEPLVPPPSLKGKEHALLPDEVELRSEKKEKEKEKVKDKDKDHVQPLVRSSALPPVKRGRVGPEGQTLERVHNFKINPETKEVTTSQPLHPLIPPEKESSVRVEPTKPPTRIEVPDPMAEDHTVIESDVRQKLLFQAPQKEPPSSNPERLSPEGLQNVQSAREFWKQKVDTTPTQEDRPKRSGPKNT